LDPEDKMKIRNLNIERSLIGIRLLPILSGTIVLYFFLLTSFGYQSVKYIAIISLLSLTLLVRKFNVQLTALMSVVYLVIFDNDVLNWTDMQIRPWYFFIMLTLFYDLCSRLTSGKIVVIKNFLVFYSFSYFFAMSLFFFFWEDFQAKLYIAKYWLFSIGLVYSLIRLSALSKISLEDGLRFWQFTVLFSTLWGLLQFIGNVSGFANDSLQHDWFNVSPSGFFSERTWYGQYAAVGAVLSFYFFLNSRAVVQLCLSLVCLMCVVISFSRSALIPLLAAGLGFLLFLLIKKRVNSKVLANVAVIVASIIVVSFFELGEGLNVFYLLQKFDGDEIGIQGRIEALDLYFDAIRQNPYGYIFGNGFSWDDSQASSIGTAIGAKSSNVLLMIFHIFGFYGAILCILLILNMLVKYALLVKRNASNQSILGFVLYTSFIGLSLVVPAHQYPSSLTILFFSIFIYKKTYAEHDINYAMRYSS
jgi:hypothetical protein